MDFPVIILRHRAAENIKGHQVDLQGGGGGGRGFYRIIQYNVSGNGNDSGADEYDESKEALMRC